MKKELFAVVLLALILGLSVLNTCAIKGLCGDLSDLVERSSNAADAGDWDSSARLLDSAMSLWREREGYTHCVLRHSDIETLTEAFYELSEHISTKDAPAAYSASELVKEHLDSIVKMETINLGSIF